MFECAAITPEPLVPAAVRASALALDSAVPLCPYYLRRRLRQCLQDHGRGLRPVYARLAIGTAPLAPDDHRTTVVVRGLGRAFLCLSVCLSGLGARRVPFLGGLRGTRSMASADAAEMSLMQMCALFRASDLGLATDLNVKETTHAAAAALGLHDDRSQPTMELAKRCRAELAKRSTTANSGGGSPTRPAAVAASTAEVAVDVVVDATGSRTSSAAGSRNTMRWKVLKHAVVGTHRLRDLQLLKPEKTTGATKLGRRLTSVRGLGRAIKAVNRIHLFGAIKEGAEKLEVHECLRQFMSAGALEMSTHVAHGTQLIEALPWAATEGARGITAQEVHANCARSLDVFEQLYAQKHKFDHAHVSLLRALKERARSYAEMRSAAPLEVVVLGGGPIGLRAAVEMALLGHKVAALTTYLLLATSYCLPPTAYCLLPTTYCLLPTAHGLLTTAYCSLLTAHYHYSLPTR